MSTGDNELRIDENRGTSGGGLEPVERLLKQGGGGSDQ